MTPYHFLRTVLKERRRDPEAKWLFADVEKGMIEILRAPKRSRPGYPKIDRNVAEVEIGERNIVGHRILRSRDISLMDREMQIRTEYLGVMAMWEYTKGVYQFNKTFFDELIKTDISDQKLEGIQLVTLPEFGVCIEFPTPLEYPFPEEGEERWIIGGLFGLSIKSDPDATNVMPVLSMVLITDKETTINLWMTLNGKSTIGEIVANDLMSERSGIYIACLSKIINILLYVATIAGDKGYRDVTPPRSQARPFVKYRKKVPYIEVPKEPVIWRFGDVIGPRLERWIEEQKQRKEGGFPRIRGPVRPHYRRAHWKLYWTGKGKKIPKLLWVHQSYVNCSITEAVNLPVSKREVASNV